MQGGDSSESLGLSQSFLDQVCLQLTNLTGSLEMITADVVTSLEPDFLLS